MKAQPPSICDPMTRCGRLAFIPTHPRRAGRMVMLAGGSPQRDARADAAVRPPLQQSTGLNPRTTVRCFATHQHRHPKSIASGCGPRVPRPRAAPAAHSPGRSADLEDAVGTPARALTFAAAPAMLRAWTAGLSNSTPKPTRRWTGLMRSRSTIQKGLSAAEQERLSVLQKRFP